MVALGDAAWDRGARDSAHAAYRAAVGRDTVASARILVRLATLEIERDRIDPAAALLRAHLRVEPADDERRVTLARLVAWRARYAEAIALYDSVLARDSAHVGAAVGRAQTLAWAGRFTESERGFQEVVRRGGSPEAERGLARLAAWRGDVLESERRWRSLAAQYPDDVDNWLGLAQTQRWAGHIAAADSSLRRALTLDPQSADARAQWQQVQSDLSHAAEPMLVHGSDSDGNRSASYTITLHSRSVGVVRWRVSGTRRQTELANLEGNSVGARARLSWSAAESRILAAGELGATRLSSRTGTVTSGSTTLGSALLVLSGAIREGNRITLAWSRSAFDETAALVARGLVTTTFDASAAVTPSPRFGVAASAGWAAITRGSAPNARTNVSMSMRWNLGRGLSLVATGREMACDTTGANDGYFCPDRFRLFEGGAHAIVGADRPWSVTADAAVGRQSVRILPADAWQSHTTVRASASMRWRPVAGYELEAAYGFSTLASSITRDATNYHARLLSIRLRLRL
jgi:tetratricopeptide (TPR) repeat protein